MIQIDMEKPSACRWTDEENNIHLCPFLDREFDCLIQGYTGYWSWDEQYKNCPLHEVIADPDTVSRQAVIECLEHLSACDEPFVEIGTDDETFIGKYEAITEISDLPPAQPKHDISKANFLCPICGAEMEVAVSEWDEGGAV